MIQYTYNGNTYGSLYAVEQMLPNVSFPPNPSEEVLASLGITMATVDDPVTTYKTYGKIGTTVATQVVSTDTYEPSSDEVLMSSEQPSANAYAKEDGTWLVPAQEYFIYHNADNKCVIDRNASYAVVEENYRSELVNLLLAINSSPLSVESGILTQEQCDTNIAAMKAERLVLIADSSTKKGLIDNEM